MAAIIMRFLPLDKAERAALSALAEPSLANWNGVEVGRIRPAAALATAPFELGRASG